MAALVIRRVVMSEGVIRRVVSEGVIRRVVMSEG
jgi:hypothetical protein